MAFGKKGIFTTARLLQLRKSVALMQARFAKCLRMLLGFGCAVFARDRFFLTHVRAALCGPVTLGPREMVDFRGQIDPNNCIRGASSFRG
jgi:hypothetical protein